MSYLTYVDEGHGKLSARAGGRKLYKISKEFHYRYVDCFYYAVVVLGCPDNVATFHKLRDAKEFCEKDFKRWHEQVQREFNSISRTL